MKTALPVFLLLAACTSLRAESPAPATPAPAADHGRETELDDTMSALNGAFKKLRRQIADPAANASSLELVARLRAAAEASIPLIPEKTQMIPEADRAKFVAAYKAKMKDFVAEVQKLETALQAGKNDEAAAVLARLGNLQKEGHREFRSVKKE
jgi:cytochrome c556